MAVDWWLLKNSDRPVLRLYDWDSPTVTIGYRQQFTVPEKLREISANWPTVVRPSGGGYLLHAAGITYSVVLPSGYTDTNRSVREWYGEIRDGLAERFLREGYIDCIETGRSSSTSTDCLGEPGDHEPVLNGRKWMASAQLHRDGSLLQHGSLFIDPVQWPSRWTGSRPSFLGSPIHPPHQNEIRDTMIDVLSETLFSGEVIRRDPFRNREWHTVRDHIPRFQFRDPHELPVFQRTGT